MAKAKYGIDAPVVIRNLFLLGVVGFILSIFFPVVKVGPVIFDLAGLIWMGISCTLMSFLMLLYSLSGKFRHRDRMLSLLTWVGDEKVLDVGTGKGLLMIGAAKKISIGTVTGIDIWNAEDLTGNNEENAVQNARLEGVAERVVIKNENAMAMSFSEGSFDVVLSNLCIHNIYNPEGRFAACSEIVRVLKPGGCAVISDFRHMRTYKKNFEKLGLTVRYLLPNYITTFPPLAIIVGTK